MSEQEDCPGQSLSPGGKRGPERRGHSVSGPRLLKANLALCPLGYTQLSPYHPSLNSPIILALPFTLTRALQVPWKATPHSQWGLLQPGRACCEVHVS